jgi:CP family cyanate transporter-like MFS transporter
MLPPIAFALSGIAAPFVARRLGLEGGLVVACVAMIVGPIVRGIAPSYPVLVIGSAIVLFGMGFGNVLLPPAVKRYFPDRIGLVTSAYVTLLAISTAMAAAVAEPVATLSGWRVSIAVWAVLAAVALLPWMLLAVRTRRERVTATDVLPPPVRLRGLHRSPVAWSITIAFAVSAIMTYAVFAWLPVLLAEHAGVSEVEAGGLLALFSIVGLPNGLIVPVLAARMQKVGWLVQLAGACFVVGFLGLWLLPAAAVLWVVVAGVGGMMFPVCLVLINTRTRTEQGSIALSGFAQTFGYAGGALGPLGVAYLHDLTGGWSVPLIALAVISLAGIVPGIALSKPRYLEDDLAAS